MATVIADTGFVVAFISKRDSNHEACKLIYRQYSEILLPQTVLAEVAYLIDREAGSRAVASFLKGLPRSRLQLAAIVEEDVSRVAEILTRYDDSRIDFVDATVMAMAERYRIQQVITVDRRDFQLFRPKHCKSFILLP